MGVPELRAQDVPGLLERGEAIVLDVREPEETAAGRIGGALLIPLGDLGARLGEVPTTTRIVAVCRSGGRSAQATEALRSIGYEVENMAGGMKAWQAAGLPLEPADGWVA